MRIVLTLRLAGWRATWVNRTSGSGARIVTLLLPDTAGRPARQARPPARGGVQWSRARPGLWYSAPRATMTAVMLARALGSGRRSHRWVRVPHLPTNEHRT